MDMAAGAKAGVFPDELIGFVARVGAHQNSNWKSGNDQ